MINNQHDIVFWATGGSIFVLILSLWFIALAVWTFLRSSRRAKVEQRLGLAEDQISDSTHTLRLWHDGRVATSEVLDAPTKTSPVARLDRMRNELGLDVPISTVILAVGGLSSIAFGIVFFLSGSLVLAVGGGGAIIVILYVFAQRQIRKKEDLFDRQLAEALSLAARSLRAGHPVLGSFQLIAEEMKPPISDMFADIIQQQALGISLDEAITAKAVQSASPDLKLFAASMSIQLRSGGNLADMMEKSAHVVRDRIKLHRRARVLTSETQLSKRVLIGIPFFLFFLLNILNPDYIEMLYTTSLGRSMLMVGGVFLLTGSWVMNKIAVLRY